MPDVQYEPFGEAADAPAAVSLSPLQRRVARVGVGLFWTLVVAIVAARALLFTPRAMDFLVASLEQGWHAVLGG